MGEACRRPGTVSAVTGVGREHTGTRDVTGPFRLSAGVGLAIAGLEAVDRDVRINLGGRGRGVAEDPLDAAQVGTALEEVGRRAVADAMRAGVPGRSGLAQALVHDAARRARVKTSAAD